MRQSMSPERRPDQSPASDSSQPRCSKNMARGKSQADKTGPSRIVRGFNESSSPCVSAHMGHPCSVNALDHQLECGHKIVTVLAPESCASNCSSATRYLGNPRSLDRPFVCMACITGEIDSRNRQRVTGFTADLETVAKATGKSNPQEWISSKLAVMQVAWNELSTNEANRKFKEGRVCHAVYLDPAFQQLMTSLAEQRKLSVSQRQLELSAQMRKTVGGPKSPCPSPSSHLPRARQSESSSAETSPEPKGSRLPVSVVGGLRKQLAGSTNLPKSNHASRMPKWQECASKAEQPKRGSKLPRQSKS